jgi:hypothetical protein
VSIKRRSKDASKGLNTEWIDVKNAMPEKSKSVVVYSIDLIFQAFWDTISSDSGDRYESQNDGYLKMRLTGCRFLGRRKSLKTVKIDFYLITFYLANSTVSAKKIPSDP